MKKVIVIAIQLFFSLFSFSQNMHFARHKNTDISGNIVSINSKSYYVERVIINLKCCNEMINVAGVSETGSALFTTSITSWPYNFMNRIYTTADKCLLALGATLMTGCDTGGKKFIVAKLDTLGNILFKMNPDSAGIVVDLVTYPDSSFYIVSSSHLSHYSKTGQFVSKINPGISAISSISLLNNGNFVISYTGNGVPKNREITSAGTFVNEAVAQSLIRKVMQTATGDLIGITGTSLQKYSSALNFIKSSTLTIPATYTITDFDLKNDSVFVTGSAPGELAFYYLLDANFNVLYQTFSNCTKIYPTGVVVDKKRKVNIISWGTSFGAWYAIDSFTGFFKTAITGSINAFSDIGVKRYSVIQADFSLVPPLSKYLGTFNVNVTVQNYGSDSVKKFHLNHIARMQTTSDCWLLLNKEFITTIPPGDSVTVQTGTFYAQPVDASELNQDGTIAYKLCVFTTVPNESYDVNITNDYFCDSISVIPMGTKEFSSDDQKITIFPNPGSGMINMSSEAVIRSIEIIDALGRVIETRAVDDKKMVLERDYLKNGLFLFKISTEKGMVIKKVLRN
jgi:hypothetical protein